MNDYRFGNFLRTMREKRGLSQQQLGRAVGVTNKAVSKWETGAAKPQVETCFKLAAVLGISVDELLTCRFQTANTGKGKFAMKQELWNKARENLSRIYGKCPPVEVLDRFASEQAAFRDSDLIVYFDFLGQLSQEARQQRFVLMPRGEVGASFVAWLMGVSPCNPLPPHYFCPNCGKTEFRQDVQDGWDLPHKRCSCGYELRREGHRIPVERYGQNVGSRSSFELDVPEAFQDTIREMLYAYFQDSARIYQVDISDYSDLQYTRYLLLPDTVDAPKAADGVLHLSAEEFWVRYGTAAYFTFLSRPLMTKLHELELRTNWPPYQVDFLNPDVLAAATRKLPEWLEPRVAPLRPLFEQVTPQCFSDFLKLAGLGHSTGVWEENSRLLLESKTANLNELIAFREDVFETVRSRMPAGAGTGLPLQVMQQAAMGKYHREGMDEATEHALRALEIPQWYIESLKKVVYLFPKAHCVLEEQLTLIAAWYVLHDPELCEGG